MLDDFFRPLFPKKIIPLTEAQKNEKIRNLPSDMSIDDKWELALKIKYGKKYKEQSYRSSKKKYLMIDIRDIYPDESFDFSSVDERDTWFSKELPFRMPLGERMEACRQVMDKDFKPRKRRKHDIVPPD